MRMNTGTDAWYMEMVVNGNPWKGEATKCWKSAQTQRAPALHDSAFAWACF